MKGQTNDGIRQHKLQRRLRNRMTDAELRFWNNEILRDIEAVADSIWRALQTPPPSQPSP